MKKERINKTFEGSFPVEIAADEFFSRLTAEDVPMPADNFDDFIQKVFSLSYPGYDFNTWHVRLLCAKAEEAFNSIDNPYLLAVLPRYHLKSTILGYGSTIYRMLKSFGEGLYISYKEDLANIHAYHIKKAVAENSELSKIMTDLSPQSDSVINYRIGKKQLKIYTSGITAVKRGLHADSIVICLTPETLVLTTPDGSKKYSGGYKRIEEIKVGDKVKTHLNRPKKVIQVFSRDIVEDIVVLHLANDEIIRITSNHPVLTRDSGWKNAGSLTAEDVLMKLKFFDSKLKNRTYLEIHGAEKADELKKNKFKNLDRSKQDHSYSTLVKKDKTYEEVYGKERAIEIREKLKGERKAREIRKCPICLTSFEVIVSSKKTFCSIECSNKFHRKGMGYNFRSKKGNFIGANNPNWRGGGIYPTVFNSSLKYKIFSRDGFVCQKCGKYGGMLNCHHVDYDKNNCAETNLVTTCRACNFAVNNKRNYWKSYFSAKVAVKYALVSNGTRILKIEKEFYSGKVYNLEVEDDNSYVGKGIIYHNCDDAMGDVLNPMIMTDIENTKKLFDAEIMQIPNKGCPMFVYGTIISNEDLFFHLKAKPRFKERVIWLPALNPDEEHDALWEARFPRKWLEAQKAEIGWKAFSTEFLLVPVLSTQAFFTKEQLDTVIFSNLQNYVVPGF